MALVPRTPIHKVTHSQWEVALHRVLLPLIVLVGIACQPSAVEFRATTTGPGVEAIMLWFEQYAAAVNSGDLEAWASFIADDARSCHPTNSPSAAWISSDRSTKTVFGTYAFDFNARVEEIIVAGDLAGLRAFFKETVTPKLEGDASKSVVLGS